MCARASDRGTWASTITGAVTVRRCLAGSSRLPVLWPLRRFERDNVADYIETDRRFHEALVSRVNNPRLTKMIMALRSDMRLYGIDTKEGRERQRASVAEHYQMIEYACAKDADRIGTLFTKHIMEWKPLFVAALSGSSSRSA
jgi:DNA-binding GntR family transcriptional regulator